MQNNTIILETFRNKDEHYVDITKTALSIFYKDKPTLVINERHCEGEKPELKQFKLKKVKFFTNSLVRILFSLLLQLYTEILNIYL